MVIYTIPEVDEMSLSTFVVIIPRPCVLEPGDQGTDPLKI